MGGRAPELLHNSLMTHFLDSLLLFEEIGIELVAEREAELNKLRLDLRQRLLAEVAVLEHISFRLGSELTDRRDVRVVEAVRSTDAQFDLVDGHIQQLAQMFTLVGVLLLVVLELKRTVITGRADENVEMAAHDGGCRLKRLLRLNAAIGPDIENELFVVGALTDTGVLHEEVDARHRREDGVDRNAADLLIRPLVAFGKAEAATRTDIALHFDGAVDIKRADLLARIEHLDVVRLGEIAGGDDARPLGLERNRLRFARIRLEQNALEVEDDIGHILRAALDRAELVIHAANLHGRDCRAFDRRKKDATERVADRACIADFERFRDETGVCRGSRRLVLLDGLRHFEAAETDRHMLPPLKRLKHETD